MEVKQKYTKGHFNLKRLLVEDGLFSRSYLSMGTISGGCLPARYQSHDHNFSSVIFAMVINALDCFSTIHRLLTDEIYHFYMYAPVEMLSFFPDGNSKPIILGQDILNDQHVQQGFHLKPVENFVLIGTTMAPAFLVQDLEPLTEKSSWSIPSGEDADCSPHA